MCRGEKSNHVASIDSPARAYRKIRSAAATSRRPFSTRVGTCLQAGWIRVGHMPPSRWVRHLVERGLQDGSRAAAGTTNAIRAAPLKEGHSYMPNVSGIERRQFLKLLAAAGAAGSVEWPASASASERADCPQAL